jgi:hypothetical protein
MTEAYRDRTATDMPSSRVRGATGVLPPKRTATGPHSRVLRRGAMGALDGNSREAKFVKAFEAELVRHVGGSPTAVQRALITRACRLALHLELWDERTIPQGGAFTASGHNHYLAWSNALGRTLARLGVDSRAAGKTPRLGDLFGDAA